MVFVRLISILIKMIVKAEGGRFFILIMEIGLYQGYQRKKVLLTLGLLSVIMPAGVQGLSAGAALMRGLMSGLVYVLSIYGCLVLIMELYVMQMDGIMLFQIHIRIINGRLLLILSFLFHVLPVHFFSFLQM